METKRKADLSAIHAQAKKTGIDEDTRRAMIERLSQGRTNSSADLTAPERAALLTEIGGGRRPPPKRAGRAPTPADLDRRAMLGKVEAQLADAKLPWAYAEAILRRQRGILDKAVACPIAQTSNAELRAVIAALSRRARRLTVTRGPESA
jgi:phage gp16-like protein